MSDTELAGQINPTDTAPQSLKSALSDIASEQLGNDLRQYKNHLSRIGYSEEEIKFLRKPINRFLQVLCFTLNIFGGSFAFTLSHLFLGYIFFYTRWWFVVPLYIFWIYYDRHTAYQGGRKSIRFRQLPIFKYFRDYFPCRLVKTVDLPPTNNYLFVVYPHGVFTYSTWINFGSEANRVESEVFPGLRIHPCGLNMHFYGPISREYFLSMGAVSISESSMLHILKDPLRGNAGVVVAGGSAEMLQTRRSNKCRIITSYRKGYVRVALKAGCALVPIFAFGENHTYDLRPCQSKLLAFIQRFWHKVSRLTLVLPQGEGFFKYITGFLPKKVPLTTVVGKPIYLPKVDNPSKELINEYHAKFLKQLQELFEKHKHQYDPTGSDAELVML